MHDNAALGLGGELLVGECTYLLDANFMPVCAYLLVGPSIACGF